MASLLTKAGESSSLLAFVKLWFRRHGLSIAQGEGFGSRTTCQIPIQMCLVALGKGADPRMRTSPAKWRSEGGHASEIRACVISACRCATKSIPCCFAQLFSHQMPLEG